MPAPGYFQMFAAYNAWANRRLYAASAQLPEEEAKRDLGAFFGSLHRTLNHLLVADRIWLKRLTGEGEAPKRLDAVLFDDFPGLRQARVAEDERFLAYTAALTDAQVGADLEYRNMAGEPFAQPLQQVLAHVFNHQTHHRGQAHALLTRLGRDAPPLDLLYYLRD